MKVNDKALVRCILNGSPDAFTDLIQCYQKRLYSFLCKLTPCREDAEEMLQDVFIRVYRYLGKYDEARDFSTWIFKICVNVFKDYYRKQKKRPASCQAPYEEMAAIQDSPEISYEEKEDYLSVIRLINALKPDQKIAILLKQLHGLTYQEIAVILKISPANAKMKVSRARQFIGLELERQKRRRIG